MTPCVGIERVGFYPATLMLDVKTFCAGRGADARYVSDDLLVHERSLNPPWEDPVTLAVNAARPLFPATDPDSIGLLIVASESGVDQEKPMSSWVHRYLELSPRCRNFEVKHACYGATGGLQIALSWLASDWCGGRSVLLINTDQSLIALGEGYEAIGGAGAVAMVLSRNPRLVAYEPGASGIHAAELTDVFRPTPRVETGNGELGMLSYLEALDFAYEDYERQHRGDVDFDTHFAWHVYHMPFPGMALRAHRTLLSSRSALRRAAQNEHYERKCASSTRYNRRVGAMYGGSTFVGLLGIAGEAAARAGDRVGIYAYGSGSCAEFQSALLMDEAAEVAREAGADAKLDARRPVTFEEYEAAERTRDAATMAPEFTPDRRQLGDWYEQRYRGQGLLVLDKVEGYYRHYGWS